MPERYDVAVVGATGAVGQTMLAILAERDFPVNRIHALASSRSAGKKTAFGDGELTIEDLADFDFSQVQIALFSAGGDVSGEYAPKAGETGCVVIDNTSKFRYDDDVPLVVPEVNAGDLAGYKQRNIIANPNCSTIQMVVALKPIYDAAGIERINVATYQSVSGSGNKGVDELRAQTEALIKGEPIEAKAYPRQIAFNILPHIDSFQDNGYTREEMKLVWETRKIMGDEEILVNPTAARVPVFYSHSEAVHIETRDELSADQARELLSKAPGVRVLDEHADGGYPTAVTEGEGDDAVWVGRIRDDISHPRGIDLWVVSDNVRKGAALNSVQIAEYMIKEYL